MQKTENLNEIIYNPLTIYKLWNCLSIKREVVMTYDVIFDLVLYFVVKCNKILFVDVID